MSSVKKWVLTSMIVLLVGSIAVTATRDWWCGLAQPLGVEWCSVINADRHDIELAFPVYHLYLIILFALLKGGFVLIFLTLALVIYLSTIAWQNLILVLLSGTITLGLVECVLRISGRVPGQFKYSQWLTQVDSLYMREGFVSDKHGIFKVDTAVAAKAYLAVRAGRLLVNDWENQHPDQNWVPEAVLVHENHLRLHDYSNLNPFSAKINAIEQAGPRTAFDSSLILYNKHPINADGFYSIPFDVKSDDRTKVLLLGDSFTWGHSTLNKTSSFSNTLLARGFQVYNTGISGADVAQYKQIVKTYFDSINPDVVILNFYMGNDVAYFERRVTNGIPLYFNTNAGNLIPFQDGIQYTTMQNTYDAIMRDMTIPKTSMVNKLAANAVIGTYFWEALVHLGFIEYSDEKKLKRPQTPFCNSEIEWISEFCQTRNTTFILSVIPNLVDQRLDCAKSVEHLFENTPYYQPQMTTTMYSKKDGHFNDEGHLFYANYLQNLIENNISSD